MNNASGKGVQALPTLRARAERDMKKKPLSKKQADIFANRLSAILRSNGFNPGPFCDPPGFSYERMSPQMAANGKDNVEFIMHVFKDAGGALDVQVLQRVITQAYGQDFTDWIAEHLEAARRADQTGSIGNHTIWMRVYEDKGIIRIIQNG
jgi:hypothetical protein